MIVKTIQAICPACDANITIEIDNSDTVIKPFQDDILISFSCSECGEYIDEEAWEAN